MSQTKNGENQSFSNKGFNDSIKNHVNNHQGFMQNRKSVISNIRNENIKNEEFESEEEKSFKEFQNSFQVDSLIERNWNTFHNSRQFKKSTALESKTIDISRVNNNNKILDINVQN
ncbi:hypothetical protein DICPUDRAFT_157745 [Dictyostelium purpureum]|uniref:Uncharacterized protein n=1 Tax=Dictyostelium purpureum TaxID=5786 RepID=F0ZZW3_DICPU|nr:uncharacterized protein DICPUDRAFT_157745 [Dictyostelium purpureum]EGC30509.1 hypothetical protein DICPUDRAFT_157745 [Dictyostelium purpureum]|eukprot:XP_003292957.1 hypothetical protein DICPUDRAFT_157745 [Dictyostelium purpureum]